MKKSSRICGILVGAGGGSKSPQLKLEGHLHIGCHSINHSLELILTIEHVGYKIIHLINKETELPS